MESNMYSTQEPTAAVEPVGLERLEAAINDLAAQPVDSLPDPVAAARVLALRRLLDRLEGHWLGELAGVDGRGAAGAETDQQPPPTTAGWLRQRLRLGRGAARQAVTTARALHRGPLAGTAQALAAGEISPAHAAVLAAGTGDLPADTTMEAEPVLLEAARQLDPPRLRRVVAHLRYVADPDAADAEAQCRYQRRGVWLSPTWEGMVALGGLLDPEAGQTLLAALEPLARPSDAEDARTGWQRNADGLGELARRSLQAGILPRSGGVRPQLLVTVDLDTLLGRDGSLGGELGWTGSLPGEACRRLACDGALTRVLVTRQPHQHADHPDSHRPTSPGHSGDQRGSHPDRGHRHPHGGWDGASGDDGGWDGATGDPTWDSGSGNGNGGPGSGAGGLAGRLRAAIRLLPPVLGGAPTQPLEVGHTTHTVSPAQRNALIVRDGGCAFPGCDRPQSWCEVHHLRHWAHGGPTDPANLVLLCWTHHRAVHEGGWRLGRDPQGRLTATPPHRRHHAA
jgi:Domain of unknown function (DUF222)/HNH endonuclease